MGKQLLTTRGALTTFSQANDVAKYFAIIPAVFAGALPAIAALDFMGLHSPVSAAGRLDLQRTSRVAAARGLSETTVLVAIEQHTPGPQWGVFGQPRVNVLLLNLALDDLAVNAKDHQ